MIKNYTRQKFKLSYFVRIKNSNLACPQASRCKAYQTSQIKYVKASQGNSREISIYIYIEREKKKKKKKEVHKSNYLKCRSHHTVE